MLSSSLHPHTVQFDQAFAPFLNDPGLPFANVLPAAEVEQAFVDAGVNFGNSKRSVFTPILTLWAFLSQVVDSTKSCSAAVLRVSILLGALGTTLAPRTRLPIAALAANCRPSCVSLPEMFAALAV